MLTEKQFDEYLRTRPFEAPGSNLAERIIASAREKQAVSPTRGVIQYLSEMLESVIPHPAYALAFMLLIGILVGLNLPDQSINGELVATSYEEEL